MCALYTYHARVESEKTYKGRGRFCPSGRTPVYDDFARPVTSATENRIRVTAAALSPLGEKSGLRQALQLIGPVSFCSRCRWGEVGLDDGSRVYFVLPKAPLRQYGGERR